MDNLVYNLQQYIEAELDSVGSDLLDLLYQLTH